MDGGTQAGVIDSVPAGLHDVAMLPSPPFAEPSADVPPPSPVFPVPPSPVESTVPLWRQPTRSAGSAAKESVRMLGIGRRHEAMVFSYVARASRKRRRARADGPRT
jgi:hypothetical protein